MPKLFFIYRKPISPYITEKTDDNFVFLLNKANPKQKVLRFLKLYDELTKSIDEDVPLFTPRYLPLTQKLIKSIIAATQ